MCKSLFECTNTKLVTKVALELISDVDMYSFFEKVKMGVLYF